MVRPAWASTAAGSSPRTSARRSTSSASFDFAQDRLAAFAERLGEALALVPRRGAMSALGGEHRHGTGGPDQVIGEPAMAARHALGQAVSGGREVEGSVVGFESMVGERRHGISSGFGWTEAASTSTAPPCARP